QDVELEIDTFLFLDPRPRVQTVAQIIVLFVGEFLERIRADVMIGDDQTVGGYKRTAPAGTEPNARFLQMVEPLLARLEIIFLFELLCWRRGVEPHSLIAKCAIAQAGQQPAQKEKRDVSHPATLIATRSSTSQSGPQSRVALADANEAGNGSSAQNKQDNQNNCILDDCERH